MIWLAWRQFRTQAAVVLGAVAIFAVLLAATGPGLADRYARGGDFLGEMSGRDTALYVLGVLAVLLAPFVIGLFWGAPLVTRELEAGTHRLIWTQTGRVRWLVTKLGLVGLSAMAATGLLSLAVTWWSVPIDKAVAARNGRPGPGFLIFPRLSQEIFDSRGIAPLGYAAFAVVLGVILGVLVGRTLPAMALLLVALTVVQIFVSVSVRPRLVAPEQAVTAITAANLTFVGDRGITVTLDHHPGAWISSQQTIDAAGRPVRPPSWVLGCPGPNGDECFARLNRLGYRQRVTYQPAGRFWTIQYAETAIYLALSLLLAALGTWWIRRRPS
jgi:hypothetical protein